MADSNDLVGLFPLREMPPGWSEILAALAIGLLLAALILGGLSFVRSRKATDTLTDSVLGLRSEAAQVRAVRLTGLLQVLTDQLAPGDAPWLTRASARFGADADVFERNADALYRPGYSIDPEPMEQALLRIARRFGV